MSKSIEIVGIFLAFIGGVSSLKDVRMWVPRVVLRGDTVLLTCHFDMEGEAIYSVKWYRGSDEFFRYSPKEEQQVMTFPMEGLTIDMSKSNMSRLVLLNVEPSLSGTYSCEVSAETSFHTELVHGDMLVVEVADQPPTVTGVKTAYRVGEKLVANCSSGPSQPPVNLTWHLNGELVDGDHVEVQRAGRLYATSSRISLVVGSHDFLLNRIRLRCSAYMYNLYNQSTEVVLYEDAPHSPLSANFSDELEEGRRTSLGGGSCLNTAVTSLIPLFFLVLR